MLHKLFKIILGVIVFLILVFVELDLLIADYGWRENQTTRLIAILSLAVFGFGLFWLLFWGKQRIIAWILILVAAVIFLFSAFLPDKLSGFLVI
ncbi:MAG: hypothetical protein KatS3mg089_0548 [Patescibacteria group bacterium]|nr:MAG: hypothetical protein KatS3mg089_0548 [Patescibacteria group bacterium]